MIIIIIIIFLGVDEGGYLMFGWVCVFGFVLYGDKVSYVRKIYGIS